MSGDGAWRVVWLVLLGGVCGEGECPESVVVCARGVAEGDAPRLREFVLFDV